MAWADLVSGLATVKVDLAGGLDTVEVNLAGGPTHLIAGTIVDTTGGDLCTSQTMTGGDRRRGVYSRGW